MRHAFWLAALLALPLSAQQENRKVLDFEAAKVIDLDFRQQDFGGGGVQDVGGTVQDLAVKEIGNEIHIDLNADVLFDFDKADVLPKAEETLKKASDVIRERGPKGTVRVEGHTDGKGDDAYNNRLSLRRADSVRNWLVKKGGLSAVNFATKGFGKTQPVAPNTNPDGSDNPEGRQKNRRVTIVMSK
jgi:outer membrane protein OmpA-like peptidoglycan-associated protein